MTVSPQQLVEAALQRSRADEMAVIVEESSGVNLRFANNTLTTNGITRSRSVTVVAAVGSSAGVMTRSRVADMSDVADLVEAAEVAARRNPPAEDATPLIGGLVDPDFAEPPEETGTSVFDRIVPGLAEAFEAARGERRRLYGFAQHEVDTTYLGTSTGVRRRFAQPTGTIDVTGRTLDRAASAWAGRATHDFTDVDVGALVGEVGQRLDWSARSIELPAGRYETLLPRAAVADLLAYMYWSMSAREAHEGRTAFARSGGGTRIGEQLSSVPLGMYSDPQEPELYCTPFTVAHASGEYWSVFDNGLPLERTHWIKDGELTALITTRHSAGLIGVPVTPMIDNLVLQPGHPGPDLAEMVASSDRALLLTCLWYIREVDPETLLLTGLTRDGVFLVEHGEVVGAVNNFRFNESPLSLLSRLSEVGPAAPTLAREFQEDMVRVATPPVRVPDFNMSSVSQAS